MGFEGGYIILDLKNRNIPIEGSPVKIKDSYETLKLTRKVVLIQNRVIDGKEQVDVFASVTHKVGFVELRTPDDFYKVTSGDNITYAKQVSNGTTTEPVEIDVDEEISETSTNPVQNKVVKQYVDQQTESVASSVDTLIEGLDARLSTLEDTEEVDIEGLSIRTTELEGKVESLETSVSSTNNIVIDVQNDVESLTSRVTTLEDGGGSGATDIVEIDFQSKTLSASNTTISGLYNNIVSNIGKVIVLKNVVIKVVEDDASTGSLSQEAYKTFKTYIPTFFTKWAPGGNSYVSNIYISKKSNVLTQWQLIINKDSGVVVNNL